MNPIDNPDAFAMIVSLIGATLIELIRWVFWACGVKDSNSTEA